MTKWIPTSKWIVGTITGYGAWLSAWISTGTFNQTVQLSLVALTVQRLATYFTPNTASSGTGS
jgi:ABC-type transport system involved in cytochrome c biogenesis permease subunit